MFLLSPIYWILAIVWYVLVVIGAWKMFEKAGIAGWKAIIPVYNIYCVFKMCWETVYFWIWAGIAVFAAFFGLETATTTGMMYWMAWILSLVQLLIMCNCCYRLSYSFGHGIWMGLGLYFFPFIFTMVLGFGSSRYVGNNGFAHQN